MIDFSSVASRRYAIYYKKLLANLITIQSFTRFHYAVVPGTCMDVHRPECGVNLQKSGLCQTACHWQTLHE